MSRPTLALLLPVALLCACSNGPAYRSVTLPSGRVVKVLGVGPIRFGSGEIGLSLTYQTDLKISDQDALRKEADEIWAAFRVDAEKAGVHSAIISANEIPEGMIIKKSRTYTFVYQKSDIGEWHQLNKEH